MKRVTIIPMKKAASLIPKLINNNTLCFYLTDDYSHYLYLKEKFNDILKIRNSSGLFHKTFQEIKEPFLELIARLNKKYDSFEWWGGQLASRNTASTPLLLNITYLFCAKKILSTSNQNVIFIVNSQALSDCISNAAMKMGYQVISHRSQIYEYFGVLRLWLYYAAQIAYFFWESFQNRRAAFKLLKPLPAKKNYSRKRILIRSWITKGNFNESGKFKDRNFGPLPAWLCSKDYEVWTLPMFFNLSMKTKKVFALMRAQEHPFLIPDHYLKTFDYIRVLFSGYKMLRRRIENAEIKKTNIVPLFNEVLQKIGFDPTLLILNLCCPLLMRLKERGFEIDSFYYAFESNAPEKQFLLCSRKYFPNSEIIGFQHTTFFPTQLAYHLGPGEKDYHPLPDKIVCSGPIYVKLHKKAGFPSEILEAGPNLRFGSVYLDNSENRSVLNKDKRMLMVPLTGLSNLSFELLWKIKEVLKDNNDYKVYVRSHPVLSKDALIEFLDKIGMESYEFADDGIIQEWLPQMYAVISAGASITILEAVSLGTPVIRVVPDNTFFYDPFAWSDYPLEPVNNSSEIRQQLQSIDAILGNDRETFLKIAKQALLEYFTEPTEGSLKVFL